MNFTKDQIFHDLLGRSLYRLTIDNLEKETEEINGEPIRVQKERKARVV